MHDWTKDCVDVLLLVLKVLPHLFSILSSLILLIHIQYNEHICGLIVTIWHCKLAAKDWWEVGFVFLPNGTDVIWLLTPLPLRDADIMKWLTVNSHLD